MQSEHNYFDYIILGAGCAGLSLAYRMAIDPHFSQYKIALIDDKDHVTNDRTWCFWEKESSIFESIVHHSWPSLKFYSPGHDIEMDLGAYQYKMIRGEDFYRFCLGVIDKASNVSRIREQVISIDEENRNVLTKKSMYKSQLAFKSYLDQIPHSSTDLLVKQHFGGFFIEMNEDVFDPQLGTFMDFNIPQEADARFFYVLPTSKRKALVEIAIFSNDVWRVEEYDSAIERYIQDKWQGKQFDINEKEYGVIPMTTYPFWNKDTSFVKHIGTAGGAVKPSSGYAFSRIQRHCSYIIKQIKEGRMVPSSKEIFKNRFYDYDATLLHVLLKQRKSCAQLFTQLFKHNKAERVLAFLNEESSVLQEFTMFSSLPILPFSKGLFLFKWPFKR